MTSATPSKEPEPRIVQIPIPGPLITAAQAVLEHIAQVVLDRALTSITSVKDVDPTPLQFALTLGNVNLAKLILAASMNVSRKRAQRANENGVYVLPRGVTARFSVDELTGAYTITCFKDTVA
jgi:hypothetical protein